MYKTLSIGAVIWDIIENEKRLGGDSLNVASNLKKLGTDSYYLTRLGKDAYGEACVARMRELEINERYIQWDENHPTGYSKVEFDAARVPSYAFAEDASDGYLTFTDADIQALQQERFDALWFSSYTLMCPVARENVFKLIESLEIPLTFFDVNIRREYHEKSMLERCLRCAAIVKMNEEEAEIVGRELYGARLSDALLYQNLQSDFNVELLCITKGALGCALFWEGNCELVAANRVTAIDTVGAGDAFSAAFILSYLRGKQPVACAVAGNFLGGYVSTCNGGNPDFTPAVFEYFGQ